MMVPLRRRKIVVVGHDTMSGKKEFCDALSQACHQHQGVTDTISGGGGMPGGAVSPPSLRLSQWNMPNHVEVLQVPACSRSGAVQGGASVAGEEEDEVGVAAVPATTTAINLVLLNAQLQSTVIGTPLDPRHTIGVDAFIVVFSRANRSSFAYAKEIHALLASQLAPTPLALVATMFSTTAATHPESRLCATDPEHRTPGGGRPGTSAVPPPPRQQLLPVVSVKAALQFATAIDSPLCTVTLGDGPSALRVLDPLLDRVEELWLGLSVPRWTADPQRQAPPTAAETSTLGRRGGGGGIIPSSNPTIHRRGVGSSSSSTSSTTRESYTLGRGESYTLGRGESYTKDFEDSNSTTAKLRHNEHPAASSSRNATGVIVADISGGVGGAKPECSVTSASPPTSQPAVEEQQAIVTNVQNRPRGLPPAPAQPYPSQAVPPTAPAQPYPTASSTRSLDFLQPKPATGRGATGGARGKPSGGGAAGEGGQGSEEGQGQNCSLM